MNIRRTDGVSAPASAPASGDAEARRTVEPVIAEDAAPPRCGLCAARDVGFCGSLSNRRLATIEASSHFVDLPAGQVLWHDDDRSPPESILVAGILRLVRYGVDGRRQILGLTMPGELIDRPTGRHPAVSLEAATTVRICRLEAARLQLDLARDDAYRRYCCRQAAAKLERLRFLTWSLGALRPDERLAGFLVFATRTMDWQPLPGGGGLLKIALNRNDIADLLGTTAESICRILGRFDAEGLIRMRGPHAMEVPDVGRLAAHGKVAPWPQQEFARNGIRRGLTPAMIAVNERARVRALERREAPGVRDTCPAAAPGPPPASPP